MIGLILKPQTCFFTPQFHVVFDELFSTVANPASNGLEDSVWPQLWQFQTCQFISDDDPAPCIHDDWLTQDERLNCQMEDRDNFIICVGRSPERQENEVIRAMENFNWDLPRHLDLLETQNTEVSGETHAPAQDSGDTHAPAQESSQEIEAVFVQEPSHETEGASAQETELVSIPLPINLEDK